MAYVPVGRIHPVISRDDVSHLDGISGHALIVERGPRAGMTFILANGVTTVGRHPESDIFLDDVTVSRHHCRLSAVGEELTIEDSGSTNGTYVNDDRIDSAKLVPGDEVLIGRFHLIVARGEAEA
ncbi:MAG: FHA domain-containing protein [Acidimicrobiia bacterium]|nr:FHA domain-containing protein [Acidimicrobiia bacterium]